MSDFYATIHDTGREFLVTGVDVKDSLEIIPNDKYRKVSRELASAITHDLEDSKITIKKISNPLELKADDLKVTKIGGLTISQEKAFSKARKEIDQRMDHSIMFDFFEILNLNNLFLHKGFNILRDQEDSFFEIISGDDEDLKASLEKYLTAYDRLSKHKNWYEKFCQFEDNIARAQDEREVDKYLTTFLTLFR